MSVALTNGACHQEMILARRCRVVAKPRAIFSPVASGA